MEVYGNFDVVEITRYLACVNVVLTPRMIIFLQEYVRVWMEVHVLKKENQHAVVLMVSEAHIVN